MAKRIIFMGVPAFGHTNPTIPMVQKLVEQGHEVRYYTVPNFKDILEEQGAEVICYTDKIPYLTVEHVNQDTHNQKNHFTVLLNLLSEAIDDVLENYLEDIEDYHPDVIVGDSLAIWAAVIAQTLNIPFVLSNTHFAFNKHTPTMLSQLSLGDNLKNLSQLPTILKEYRKIKKLGYPTKHLNDLALTRTDCPVIVTTSRSFQPAGETFGSNIHFTGPIIRSSQSVWPKSQRPLAYISLGTVNNQAETFYKDCFLALGNRDLDVILSVGNQTNIDQLKPIPPNFKVYHKVDQMSVLKEADVFLTHCGLNSTSEALYYKVPLLLFPQTDEQEIVAQQVLKAGAGIRLENSQLVTITQGIDRLLNDPVYKQQAERVSQDFILSGGVDAAVAVILGK